MPRDEKFPDNGFEAWGGYMQAKKAKLEEQFSSRVGKEQTCNIFNGISIFVNGYTNPSADELKEIMARHGGVYHTYQRSEDFIIASNLPDTKVKNMCISRVVKPEWITDCLESKSLLDYKDYLLYRNSKTQPRLNFQPQRSTENKIQIQPMENMGVKQENSFNNNLSSHSAQVTLLESACNKLLDIPTTSASEDIKFNRKSDTATKTACDPNFISEFYNNSRLHHISQLGAHFKQLVNELREKSNFTFPAREKLKETIASDNTGLQISQESFQNNKTIMHIDMDCFFVSVGLRDKPELNGKPVAVTHSKGGQPRPKRPGVDRETEFNMYRQRQAKKLYEDSGIPMKDFNFETRVDNVSAENDKYGSMSEIASCSYEARAKGISNGMFMGAALKLCPNLQTIPYDFDGYKEVAHTLYNTIAQYTLDIEAVSCDEMYVDCTELLATMNVNVQDFASALRKEIKSKTGCPCSTGFGGNRLQARLATKQAKPDGQFFLTSNLVDDYMFNIKLKDLPGVGRQTMHKLESLGHQTCGSLQSLSLVTLQHHFGNKTGAQLFDQCRGQDPNPLSFYTVRKSVSAEVNYGIRFENNNQCEEFLKQLSEEVHSRMQQFKVLGKCITLKLMVRAQNAPVETAKFMGHGFCDVINKSVNLHVATNDMLTITKEVIAICRKMNIDPKEMRGIGIQVTKLESLHTKETKGSLDKFLTAVKPEINKSKDNAVPQDKPYGNLKEMRYPTTPKKEKISSPQKRSPILGSIKSPTGKKRGRPFKTNKPPVPSSKNLMSKFLQGQSFNQQSRSSETVRNNTNKEIVKEPTKIKVENPKIEERKPQGLLALPWQRVRELLRAWFDSGQTPKACDVNLIVTYMQDMIIHRNIEKLNVLVNFIRRRAQEINKPVWYEVEANIIEQVQNAMLAVYGKKLWISDD